MSSSMTTLQSSFQLSLTLLVRHVSVYKFDLEKSFFKILFNFPSRYLFNFYCHFLHVEVSDVNLLWKEFLQSSFQLSLTIFVNFLHVEVPYISIHLKRLPSELFSTFPRDTWIHSIDLLNSRISSKFRYFCDRMVVTMLKPSSKFFSTRESGQSVTFRLHFEVKFLEFVSTSCIFKVLSNFVWCVRGWFSLEFQPLGSHYRTSQGNFNNQFYF